jgi:signal peptidase I
VILGVPDPNRVGGGGLPGRDHGWGDAGSGETGSGAAGPGDAGPGDAGRGDQDGDGEPAGWPAAVAALAAVIRETVLVLGIALGLSLLIKTLLVQAFFIPSPSMESTLIKDDRVLVSKLTPGPFDLRRGDIVVFSDSGDWLGAGPAVREGGVRGGVRSALTFLGLLPSDSDEHLIKRLIGLPGDTVKCCDSKGRISVNGTPITEPYVYDGDAPSERDFTVTVPADRLWVLGDHRSVSQDSRFHRELNNGTVPISDVVGRAFVVVWPLNRATLLRNPGSVFADVPAPAGAG